MMDVSHIDTQGMSETTPFSAPANIQWRHHHGEERPVAGECPVYVRLRNGWESPFTSPAGALRWAHAIGDQSLSRNDIVAYALVPWTPSTVYIRFADNGSISKWSFDPFDGATEYTPVYQPAWDNPDGPGAA